MFGVTVHLLMQYTHREIQRNQHRVAQTLAVDSYSPSEPPALAAPTAVAAAPCTAHPSSDATVGVFGQTEPH